MCAVGDRCREILRNSPTALRVLKSAMNAAEDGDAGIQVRAAIWGDQGTIAQNT